MKRLVLCLVLVCFQVFVWGAERGNERQVSRRANINPEQRQFHRESIIPNYPTEIARNVPYQNVRRRQKNIGREQQVIPNGGSKDGQRVSVATLAALSIQSRSSQNARKSAEMRQPLRKSLRREYGELRQPAAGSTVSSLNPETGFESRRMRAKGRGLSQAMLSMGLPTNTGAFATTAKTPGTQVTPFRIKTTTARSKQPQPNPPVTQRARRIVQNSSLKPSEIYQKVRKTKPVVESSTPSQTVQDFPASNFTFPPFPHKNRPKSLTTPIPSQKTSVTRTTPTSKQINANIPRASREVKVKPITSKNGPIVQNQRETTKNATRKDFRSTTMSPNFARVGRNLQSSDLRGVSNTGNYNLRSNPNFNQIQTSQNTASSLAVPNFRRIESIPNVGSTVAPNLWGFGSPGNFRSPNANPNFGGQPQFGVWNSFWDWVNPNFRSNNVSPFFRRIDSQSANEDGKDTNSDSIIIESDDTGSFSQPPANDNTPVYPEEDNGVKLPEVDDSSKLPEEDDTPKFPEENDSPKLPEEDDSLKLPEEDESPKLPDEDDSPKVPEEDDSPKLPKEDDSPKLPQEDDSPKPPQEDDSPKPPQEDDSPKPPQEDDSPKLPEEDDSPKLLEEDDNPKLPEEDDSPKLPEDDDSPKLPEEDDRPKLPEEDDSPKLPEEDDSPKLPEEDGTPKLPGEDDSPKLPEEDDSLTPPGEKNPVMVPGTPAEFPSTNLPPEDEEYEVIPPGIKLSPYEREEGVYPVYPIEWSVPGYPLNQKDYLRTAGKDSDIENVRVAKRCRLGYFYSLHSDSCIGFIGKQVPQAIVQRKNRKRTNLSLDFAASDANKVRRSRNTNTKKATKKRGTQFHANQHHKIQPQRKLLATK